MEELGPSDLLKSPNASRGSGASASRFRSSRGTAALTKRFGFMGTVNGFIDTVEFTGTVNVYFKKVHEHFKRVYGYC